MVVAAAAAGVVVEEMAAASSRRRRSLKSGRSLFGEAPWPGLMGSLILARDTLRPPEIHCFLTIQVLYC